MKRPLAALLLVALAMSTSFADPTTKPATHAASHPGAHPATQSATTKPVSPLHDIKVEKDIRYVPGGDKSQALDLYIPQNPENKPLPLIIWVHGGGWKAGSKSSDGGFIPFLHQGYAVASVEYRFSDKATFPAQIQDCQAAVRWLRANSKKYNIDPDHFGAWGGSAGGHLVALMGTSGGKKSFPPIGGNEDQSDAVQAVVDFYGPVDFNTLKEHAMANKRNVRTYTTADDPASQMLGSNVGENKEVSTAASPVHYITKDNPPVLIAQGEMDPRVPMKQSEEFLDLLVKAGVEAELIKVPGAGHGGPQFNKPPVSDKVKEFFDRHLKGAK